MGKSKFNRVDSFEINIPSEFFGGSKSVVAIILRNTKLLPKEKIGVIELHELFVTAMKWVIQSVLEERVTVENRP